MFDTGAAGGGQWLQTATAAASRAPNDSEREGSLDSNKLMIGFGGINRIPVDLIKKTPP